MSHFHVNHTDDKGTSKGLYTLDRRADALDRVRSHAHTALRSAGADYTLQGFDPEGSAFYSLTLTDVTGWGEESWATWSCDSPTCIGSHRARSQVDAFNRYAAERGYFS